MMWHCSFNWSILSFFRSTNLITYALAISQHSCKFLKLPSAILLVRLTWRVLFPGPLIGHIVLHLKLANLRTLLLPTDAPVRLLVELRYDEVVLLVGRSPSGLSTRAVDHCCCRSSVSFSMFGYVVGMFLAVRVRLANSWCTLTNDVFRGGH